MLSRISTILNINIIIDWKQSLHFLMLFMDILFFRSITRGDISDNGLADSQTSGDGIPKQLNDEPASSSGG